MIYALIYCFVGGAIFACGFVAGVFYVASR